MELTPEERNHFEENEKRYYELTGVLIGRLSIIEMFLREILSINFARDSNSRVEIFQYFVEPLQLSRLVDIFMMIITEKYSDFYGQNPKIDRLRFLRKKRNLFAHSHYRADEAEIRKFDNTRFPIQDLRQHVKTPVMEVTVRELEDLYTEAFQLSVTINEFRKGLKTGAIQG